MPATLFISYSRADIQETNWLTRLNMYLSPLVRNGVVEVWDDQRIPPGASWDNEIQNALSQARAAVLLVGPGYLASEYVASSELPQLLGAARTRGVRLFPVVVGHCGFKHSVLKDYQTVNPPGNPLESLPPKDQNRILNDVAVAIADAMLASQTPVRQHAPRPDETYLNMSKLKTHLGDTAVAFDAQAKRRDALVARLERRLRFKNTLEYERFFFEYHPAMNEQERFEFDQIRAITEGSLHDGNQAMLRILENQPKIMDLSPHLLRLRQHLVFWLNKFDRVFVSNRAMCLLYTGVEDGVPFPREVDAFVTSWLRGHKAKKERVVGKQRSGSGKKRGE